MNISYSRTFIKQAKKLTPGLRIKVVEKVTLFADNPLHPSLRNHALKGKYKTYRSIDITSDMRALYSQHETEVIFDQVGTHSQLYS